MGKSFKRIIASSVGSFGENTDKIPQWIKANGGTYMKDVDTSVTHIIASEAAIKKNVDAVKKARRFKGIKIVNYSWLEDSLLSKSRCPKRVGPYLWDRILNEQKTGKSTQKNTKGQTIARQKKPRGVDREKTLGEFSKGARAIVSEMESLGYHLYVDKASGTTYTATLVRSSIINGRERKEKYLTKVSGETFETLVPANRHLLRVPIYDPFAQQIQLYESNAEPHTYATFVKYSRVGASGKDILSPRGSSFDLAVTVFKKFFKIKTGIAWEDRHDEPKIRDQKKTEGELGPPDEAWYSFEQPTGLMASLSVSVEMLKARDDKSQAKMSSSGRRDACEPQTCNESIQGKESASATSPMDEDVEMAEISDDGDNVDSVDEDADQDTNDGESQSELSEEEDENWNTMTVD